MNEREYAVATARIAQLWPHSPWPTATCHGAESMLLDLPAGAVVAAVEALASEGREFAPPPGLVRKTAMSLMSGEMPPPDEALREVLAAVAHYGIYRTPEFSHPAVEAAVNAITWPGVCNSENPEAFRAHFLKLYGAVTERKVRELALPPSVGELVAGLDLRLERTEIEAVRCPNDDARRTG